MPEKRRELLSEQEPQPLAAGKETEQVQGPDTVTLYRNRAKHCVFSQLVAGHCTLAQAAIFFRILDGADPDFKREALDNVFSGQSIEERYCREVIAWAKSWDDERHSAENARNVRERLEGEFAGTVNFSSVSKRDKEMNPARE